MRGSKVILAIPLGAFRTLLWICFAGLSVAAQADNNPVTVAIAPSVQQMVQALPAKERNRASQAIKVGNKFVRLRFFNQDWYDPETDDDWKKKVGPLMAMSGEEWRRQSDEWDIQPVTVGGQRGIATRLVCPLVRLASVKSSSSGFTLGYQAAQIGSHVKVDTSGVPIFFIDKSHAGKLYQLDVDIGPSNRITAVRSTEKIFAYAYSYEKAGIEGDIRFSENTNTMSEQYARERAKRLRNLIQDIDAATAICNSTNH